jgi:hypothetical protein
VLKRLKTATLPHSRRDFLGLAFRAQQVAAAVALPGVSAGAQGPQQVCPLFEGGQAAQGVAAESRGSGNKTNDASTTAAGCYQRNRAAPDADIATAAMGDRRVAVIHQHTNSITSDEHEGAIHSEDLTVIQPALALARARRRSLIKPLLVPNKCRIAKLNCRGSCRKAK